MAIFLEHRWRELGEKRFGSEGLLMVAIFSCTKNVSVISNLCNQTVTSKRPKQIKASSAAIVNKVSTSLYCTVNFLADIIILRLINQSFFTLLELKILKKILL